jgi:hypothetical protein
MIFKYFMMNRMAMGELCRKNGLKKVSSKWLKNKVSGKWPLNVNTFNHY